MWWDEKQKQRAAFWKHLRGNVAEMPPRRVRGAHRSGAGGLSPLLQPQTRVLTHQPCCVWPRCQGKEPRPCPLEVPAITGSPHTIIPSLQAQILLYACVSTKTSRNQDTVLSGALAHNRNCNCKMRGKGKRHREQEGPRGAHKPQRSEGLRTDDF